MGTVKLTCHLDVSIVWNSWEPQPPGVHGAYLGLYSDSLTFTFYYYYLCLLLFSVITFVKDMYNDKPEAMFPGYTELQQFHIFNLWYM
jgi:hypothetical protein